MDQFLTLERPEGSIATGRPGRAGLGERLRQHRRSLGLSLNDVQARTGGEFKASALGAYERGERGLTIDRLSRLAAVYNVDASVFMSSTIDLPVLHALEEWERETPDEAFVLASLARFAAYIRARRNEPTLTPLSIRVADVDYLTVLLGRDAEQVRELLGRIGLGVRQG